MRKDLEEAYRAAVSLLQQVKEKLPLAEDARDVSSLAQAFSKASGELRQLYAALKDAADTLPHDEAVPVLIEAILALPEVNQAQVLLGLQAQAKPRLWPAS